MIATFLGNACVSSESSSSAIPTTETSQIVDKGLPPVSRRVGKKVQLVVYYVFRLR